MSAGGLEFGVAVGAWMSSAAVTVTAMPLAHWEVCQVRARRRLKEPVYESLLGICIVCFAVGVPLTIMRIGAAAFPLTLVFMPLAPLLNVVGAFGLSRHRGVKRWLPIFCCLGGELLAVALLFLSPWSDMQAASGIALWATTYIGSLTWLCRSLSGLPEARALMCKILMAASSAVLALYLTPVLLILSISWFGDFVLRTEWLRDLILHG